MELCVQDPRLTQHTCMLLDCGPYSVWVSCHGGKRGEEVKKLVLPWYGAKARQSVICFSSLWHHLSPPLKPVSYI